MEGNVPSHSSMVCLRVMHASYDLLMLSWNGALLFCHWKGSLVLRSSSGWSQRLELDFSSLWTPVFYAVSAKIMFIFTIYYFFFGQTLFCLPYYHPPPAANKDPISKEINKEPTQKSRLESQKSKGCMDGWWGLSVVTHGVKITPQYSVLDYTSLAGSDRMRRKDTSPR